MDHLHTGRRLAGFRHRARQGADVARALWPRVSTARQRLAALAVLTTLVLTGMVWTGSRWEPSSVPVGDRATKVVVFGMPHLGLDDLGTGSTPNLDRAVAAGAVGAMSVRTVSGRPSATEAYATLGAGVRVRAGTVGRLAYEVDTPLEAGTAGDALMRLTGHPPAGEVAVVGGPFVRQQVDGLHLSSEPGALGDALHRAGRRTGVVGNADTPGVLLDGAPDNRPAAVGVMDRGSTVDTGTVERGKLLEADAARPFGLRADPTRMTDAVVRALATADVVVVDPGDLGRAAALTRFAAEPAAEAARARALRDTDAVLGRVRAALPSGTLLYVLAVVPKTATWTLTPAIAVGPGVAHGTLYSPSTKRAGVVTLTDVAPSILDVLGAEVPDGMVGRALRVQPGAPDLGRLRALQRDTDYRERIYVPVTKVYVIFLAILYLLIVLTFARRAGAGRARPAVRFLVLTGAAFPLATFLLRAIPGTTAIGFAGMPILVGLAVAVALLAQRARRHPLSPLAWIMGATVAVIVADVTLGSRLHVSSVLGYSLHSAGRFYGIPNTTFAVLAACTLLLASIVVQRSERRTEALAVAAAIFVVVLVADGLPFLGNDVGGVVALTPVFAFTLLAFRGRGVTTRHVLAIVAVTVAAVAAVGVVDLLRPPETRSHFSQFLGSVFGGGDGSDVATTTFLRKQSANFRILTKSVWTWIIPSAAILVLYLLAWDRRGDELLPRGSPLRVGLVAAVAGSLAGFAVNDSGPVVIALFFVFVCPYLTLLALHPRTEAPSLLSPPRAAPEVAPASSPAPTGSS
jgi:hypothetical protein